MTPLNQRETEILRLVSEGRVYKQIVRQMDLELPTIKFYVRSAKNKLGASTIGHAVAMFVRMDH